MADDRALLRLLSWLSPAFPVGSYAFSHGLEAAIADGRIRDKAGLGDWIAMLLLHGAGRSDGALLAAAYRAAAAGDGRRLAEVAERASVFRATAELATESEAQGKAFLAAIAAGWPEVLAAGDGLLVALSARRPPAAYAVAVGASAAVSGLGLRPTLLAYLAAFAAGLVSAGVRLIPLGQAAGLQVIAALEATIVDAAERALVTDIADLASATWVNDLSSARHETQRVRLFRS